MTSPHESGLRREAFARHKRGHKVKDIALSLGKSEAWVRAAIADQDVVREVMQARRFYPFPDDAIDRGLKIMKPFQDTRDKGRSASGGY